MNDMETVLKKSHIRLMRHPETCLYAGVMLLGESTVEDNVPTAYTDGFNKRYGRKFMESLTVEEISALVLHENLHVMLKHLPRHKDLMKENSKLANIAMDFVVNDIIVEIGKKDASLLSLPKGGLYDPKYHNWSVREVYNDLKNDEKNGGGGGRMKPLDEHDMDGVEGASPEELKGLSDKINEAIQQGGMLAGKFGVKVPRVIQDLMEPKLSWRDVLRDFVSSACRGAEDYTWRKLNRRRLADDIYLPSTISERVGELIIAIDTSGSIDSAQLTEFASEIVAICDTVNPEKVRVLWWDTEVHGEQVFEGNYDGIAHMLKPQGGGGTIASCVSEFLIKKSMSADCLVMFTDGYIEDNVKWDTKIPTLWVVTRKIGFKPVSGTAIRMDKEV
jgi:predicted metal-dependent peptidase